MKSPLLDRVCGSIARRSGALFVMMMALLVSIGASDALAQDALRPPTTKEPPSGPKFIMMGIALLLTGLVVYVSVMPSKRGHQD